MRILQLLQYTIITYLLLLLGTWLGRESLYAMEPQFGMFVSFLILIILATILNILLKGSTRNIVNYIIIGVLFGGFVLLTGDDIMYSDIIESVIVGELAILLFFSLYRYHVRQPIIYFLMGLGYILYIAYYTMNSDSAGHGFSLIFFGSIVPILTLINVAHYNADDKRGYFTKNPLIITVFPVLMFGMPAANEVVLPEPYEVINKEQEEDDS